MNDQEIMKLSNSLAENLAAIVDDDDYRHWISYFFETLEGKHDPVDRDGAIEISFEILEERLVNGRW